MKKPFFAVLALCLYIPFFAYAGPIQGAGAGSCGEWTEDRKANSYHPTLHWVQGFISAYNQYIYIGNNPNGVFGGADYKAIAAWMDNYCHTNPLSTPFDGTLQLVKELKNRSK